MQNTPVYLGLGGNLGDVFTTLNRAVSLISAIPGVKLINVSNFYRTSPVGDLQQPDYFNAVCLIETNLTPLELLKETQAIERQLGKIPKPKTAPRPIDIDILLFGDTSYLDSELEVPHPHWKERLFVLVPLRDLTETILLGSHTYKLDELIHSLHSSGQTISIYQPKN